MSISLSRLRERELAILPRRYSSIRHQSTRLAFRPSDIVVGKKELLSEQFLVKIEENGRTDREKCYRRDVEGFTKMLSSSCLSFFILFLLYLVPIYFYIFATSRLSMTESRYVVIFVFTFPFHYSSCLCNFFATSVFTFLTMKMMVFACTIDASLSRRVTIDFYSLSK